jgi:hypothetical protein
LTASALFGVDNLHGLLLGTTSMNDEEELRSGYRRDQLDITVAQTTPATTRA